MPSSSTSTIFAMITRGFTARAIVTAHAALTAPSPEATIWARGREQQSRPVAL
jgi:hypothetical protein